MHMTECERLADLLDRVLDGDPWHGPNVMGLLDGVSPQQAASNPVPGAHSMWELVLHMTGWANEVRARLEGGAAGEPSAGDWPAVPEVTPGAWSRSVQALVDSHRTLAAAIRRAGDAALVAPVIDHRDRAAGTGMSKYLTLHGLVHHTAYHSGQLAMLRRALGTDPS
jgi:hypothetical protein